MLVLTRRTDEVITIGDPSSGLPPEIEITVVEVRGGEVRIGIQAPRTTPVHRREIYDEIQAEIAGMKPETAGMQRPGQPLP